MTRIPYSNSLSLANDFAIRLFSGLLNVRASGDAGEGPLAEVKYTTAHFTTERMAELRVALSGSRISQLEAADSQTDPDSLWPASELRHISIHVRKNENKDEILVATFDVHRDYLDGDNAEGWTCWQVKNVYIFLTDIPVELVPEYLNRDDREPIWGTRVS